ncbi:MAG: LysM peptidoglycan-binding domain-containing protein [Chthoniobacteraceae bacterium]|nr:LysM peptidoglycan-binding domain-containing protein [Chthoniobacteraceae bacterium]
MSRRLPPAGFALAAVAAMFCLGGCDQAFQNTAERNFVQAERKFSQQEYTDAVMLYEASLDGTPKTAEVHFKLGLMYDDQIKNPIAAIHHFQRYVEMAPDGPHARDAQRFLKEDQLKLTAQLGNGASVSQEEAKRIKNANQELQKKILQLKDDLEAANKARIAAYKALGTKGGPGGGKPEQIQKPLLDGVRTYTVGPGDTLASIARKFYKNNSARWKDIQDANFQPMDGTAKLKPGMILMVP